MHAHDDSHVSLWEEGEDVDGEEEFDGEVLDLWDGMCVCFFFFTFFALTVLEIGTSDFFFLKRIQIGIATPEASWIWITAYKSSIEEFPWLMNRHIFVFFIIMSYIMGATKYIPYHHKAARMTRPTTPIRTDAVIEGLASALP